MSVQASVFSRESDSTRRASVAKKRNAILGGEGWMGGGEVGKGLTSKGKRGESLIHRDSWIEEEEEKR